MDQQHQNYESFNDFGFVNAFAAGSENSYAINQNQQSDMSSKTLNELGLPTLMNQPYDARAIENSSLYDLSNPQYSHMHQYQHQMAAAAAAASAIGLQKPPGESYNAHSMLTNAITQQVAPISMTISDQPIEAGTSKSAPETVNFDASQNSMMKALGVVRKDVLGTNSNKKRKRIVLLNDEDSDDASDLKSEVFDKSNESEGTTKDVEEKNTSEADNESEPEEPENLTDIGALKAKFLLKNAVIIQGPDKKKKKQRLLDSDDEEQIHTTSIDDIGLVNENENEEESFENDILITEPIIPIENPDISAQSSSKVEEEESKVVAAEKSKETDACEPLEKINQPTSPKKIENAPSKSEEKKDLHEKDTSNEKGGEEGPKSQSAEDNEIDPAMSVEAILENIKPMADDDEFFKFDHSSEETDKTVPNDEYFGTPDKPPQGQSTYTGKKRGPKPGSKRIPRDPGSDQSQRRKRGDRYEDDFVDDSDDSESSGSEDFSDSSESTSESSEVEEVITEKRPRGRPPSINRPSLAPVLIQAKSYSSSITKVPSRHKRDRFYDRSRDIPNDVYFGDVNVPLHVLHTRWGSDVDSDDERAIARHTQMPRGYSSSSFGSSSSSYSYSSNSRPQYTYIHDYNEEPKLSSLREFVHLCGIKVNYQKLFDGIKSSDHKCALLRRILAQKGMQGEPTVAKCKILRRELQAKRESAELDKSVIITAGGRTRRATRNANQKKSYAEDSDDYNYRSTPAVVQPATLQTLSKIRQVIDSDSE